MKGAAKQSDIATMSERERDRGGEKGKEEGDESKKSKAHAEEYKANKQCAHELETNWNHSERHTELLPIAISNCP